MSFVANFIVLIEFDNKGQLQDHLHDLFSVDASWRWVNRHTQGDWLIIGDSVYTISTNMAERKGTEKMARNLLRKYRADYKTLYTCCIAHRDINDEQLLIEVKDIMRRIDAELKKYSMKILFCVTHNDQGDLHSHLIIYNFR